MGLGNSEKKKVWSALCKVLASEGSAPTSTEGETVLLKVWGKFDVYTGPLQAAAVSVVLKLIEIHNASYRRRKALAPEFWTPAWDHISMADFVARVQALYNCTEYDMQARGKLLSLAV